MTVVAFAVACFLHAGFFLVVPEEILPKASIGRAESGELEVMLEPLSPDQMRYVEASPDAPENEPDRSDQYSYRSQQAADENPVPSEIDEPDVGGDEDSQKIQQGSVEQPDPLPPGVYTPEVPQGEDGGIDGGQAGAPAEPAVAESPPLPPPDFIEQTPDEDDGTGSRPETPPEVTEREPDPEAPINVYRPVQQAADAAQAQTGEGSGGEPEARPLPRERPRLSPELTRGPLMRTTGSASRRGAVAIDATFSEFGEYEQQFYAAIQAGWYQEIEFFQPIDTASRVRVRFTIRSDGSIEDLEVIDTTASQVATMICESAIAKRSPFRPWTREMVEVFGDARTINVSFHYR